MIALNVVLRGTNLSAIENISTIETITFRRYLTDHITILQVLLCFLWYIRCIKEMISWENRAVCMISWKNLSFDSYNAFSTWNWVLSNVTNRKLTLSICEWASLYTQPTYYSFWKIDLVQNHRYINNISNTHLTFIWYKYYNTCIIANKKLSLT